MWISKQNISQSLFSCFFSLANFIPGIIINPNFDECKCMKCNLIFDYQIGIRICIKRIAGSETSYHVPSQILLIFNYILEITLSIAFQFHTEYIACSYYYSLCHIFQGLSAFYQRLGQGDA